MTPFCPRLSRVYSSVLRVECFLNTPFSEPAAGPILMQNNLHTLLLLSSLIFCLISEEVLDVNHCLFVLTHFPFLEKIMKIFLAVNLLETSEGFLCQVKQRTTI